MKSLLISLAALVLSGCATTCCSQRDLVDVQTPYGAECYRDCLKVSADTERGEADRMECFRWCPGIVVTRVCR